MDGNTYAFAGHRPASQSRPGTDAEIIDARELIARERANRSPGQRRYRVVLYSHDSMGLGHIRRNVLLAQFLSESAFEVDILLITGARESGSFKLPRGVDLVSLPALHKAADGTYHARNLGVGLDGLTRIRSHIVHSAIESFQPDLVIIDNVARGVNGELDKSLRYIREQGRIRCVLGLRDIQDEAENLRREWNSRRCLETIRQYYDAVWVYGDARVFDPRMEYDLPLDIARKLQFTGYLDPCHRLATGADDNIESGRADKPFGLCQVGGGQDGAALALAFARAQHPPGTDAVIITGPYIDPESLARLRQLAAQRAHLEVLEFVAEPTRILRDAEYVVCMGGYNTVCEVIAFEKPALVVPRISPRREQIVRAERLAALDIIDMLHPDLLDADSLSRGISRLARRSGTSLRGNLDMNAAKRVPEFFLDQIRQLEKHLGKATCWAESI
jgi:predicted glycosyltransferase